MLFLQRSGKCGIASVLVYNIHKNKGVILSIITILTNSIVGFIMAIVTKRAEERVTFTRGMRVKVALFLSFKKHIL